MAATFGSLQTKISKKLLDPNQTAIAATDVADAINDALHFWKYKPFWFNQRQTTITMDTKAAADGSASSDPYILGYGNSIANYPSAPVLPQLFLFEMPEDGFVIYWNNLYYPQKKVPPFIYDVENVHGIGLPTIYCFRNGNYEFYFYPNIAYSMIVNYVTDYADLVNSTDTNDFTANADRLLMYEALSHLYGEQRQDQQSSAYYAQAAQREYENIMVRGSQQAASGSLTYECIV